MKRKRKQPFTTGDRHHIFRLREHECTYPPAISTCAQWHLSRKCKSHKFWKDNDSKWTKVNISTQAILAFLKGVETWDNESCKSPHQWVMQQHEKVSHENPSVNFYYVLISAALSQGARGRITIQHLSRKFSLDAVALQQLHMVTCSQIPSSVKYIAFMLVGELD